MEYAKLGVMTGFPNQPPENRPTSGSPGQFPDSGPNPHSQPFQGSPGQPSPYENPQQVGHPYPAAGPHPGTQSIKQKNTVGRIALVVAILGTILSCIPGIVIVGWILLPIGFILGLVGLFMANKSRRSSIAAVIISIVGTIVAVVAFIAIIGSAVDDALGGGDVTVSGPGQSESAGGDIGSRESPAAIGDTLSGRDWEVTINSFNRNSTDQVMAANTFNDAPPAGSQYALVNLTATYIGDDSGLADFISVAFVTDNGTVIRSSDSFAVAPDPLEGELYNGASATGNVDLAIPDGEPGLLRVDLGILGGEVFVSVE